ncbi:MAG: (2Fe-2S)-binding protein [Deltaproteobacteria bacterium]|nr:(2Fe-2S)-binding protein [Deltaproteobacteria bacterium]
MPTFKIDGKEVEFQEGDTILRAAHRAGVEIPYYCWHPGLTVATNCRMCLVEILPEAGRKPLTLDVLRWDPETGTHRPEKKPKLQPACQIPAAAGMEILSDSSAHVREARRSVQEFLLLNHPVDCPICDQAGECKLQDYWLAHQKTSKRMRDEIIHKPKATVFGPTIVYDAERCIVCTRCVRFCAEVAKDPVLEKRERGNTSEIVVAPGRSLDHPYTLMTEHVCPVGALTSKDFRFKARVWFLRSARSICQGCATGCNSWLDFDPRYQKAYRYRPRDNEAVNRYWMCDEGMLSYKWAHNDRITHARIDGKQATLKAAIAKAAERIKALPQDSTAVVLSAQHSNEDNFALVTLARTHLGLGDFFLSGKPVGECDDILRHPDKNPNTAGATDVTTTTPPRPFDQLLEGIEKGRITHVLAIGSAVPVDADEAGKLLKKLKALIVTGIWDGPLTQAASLLLPACSWAETDGTYVNSKGIAQRSMRALQPLGDARPGWEILARIAAQLGHPMNWTRLSDVHRAMAPEAGAVAATTAEP